MKTLLPLLAVILGLGLGACTKPGEEAAVSMGDAVVGPDMDKTGPFENFERLTLAAVPTEDTPPDSKLMRIEVKKGSGEDIATLYNLLSDHKPYLAGVTYHPFTPVVAETNADRKDYWIVGLNLSRTPDRSVYSILRFPHGSAFTRGQTVQVEYLNLGCFDLSIARTPVSAYDPANAEPTFEPEFAAEADQCEFNSLTEAYAVTPLVLRKYDQIKHFPDAPKPNWLPLTVTVE
ncbi:hypothetical protein [Asticcacaulis excentricus]|uniref:Lipoprotein n=1 Tax=Asticcacaulis excentricus (strain ATCC 15261 / DSM 4724 / KCTC 12464 / NCIMB 9791 / VKM B-1370 / CB 48) TaxID=573065 RepID=E8RRI1_ASTEC|nr:hypothetical protein [Asticcacaulis excentricus]ADU13426.1 hypothetical protein Astex_1760 [Asticcacaulis excentricus CB 48]